MVFKQVSLFFLPNVPILNSFGIVVIRKTFETSAVGFGMSGLSITGSDMLKQMKSSVA